MLAHISVLTPDYPSPAGLIADEVYVGDLDDYNAVMELAEDTDVLSYEIEHVNTAALHDLECSGRNVIPPSFVLGLIKDKMLQKKMLDRAGIPTAAWREVPEAGMIDSLLREAEALGGFPLVQKARRGGYDGRGVCVLDSAEAEFLPVPSFLEKKVPIQKELAVICVMDASGSVRTYPCVEMVFDPRANLCDSVLMPARIDEALMKKAEGLALAVVEALKTELADYCSQVTKKEPRYAPVMAGVFAVELFLDTSGNILVNEIAPRPHNSGHVTIENCVTSQFMQYYRILSGYPLGSTEMVCPAMMVNLLGEADASGEPSYVGIEEALKIPGVFLHLYGKSEVRPFRKMGHLTAIAPTVHEAIRRAELAREKIRIVSL